MYLHMTGQPEDDRSKVQAVEALAQNMVDGATCLKLLAYECARADF